MRGGASDRLYHASSLSIAEVLDLYYQVIREELYPLIEEEGIETEITSCELAHVIATAMYQQHGDDAPRYMKQSLHPYVRGLGYAIESGDYSDIAM